MSKLALLSVFLLTITLCLVTPCLAEDAKSAKSGKPEAQASSQPDKEGAQRRGRGGRGWGKKAVLELQSLTDKQKTQINGIYDGDKPQWENLEKQMRELHEAEWSKVKAVLTADQLKELQSERHSRGHEHEASAKDAQSGD